MTWLRERGTHGSALTLVSPPPLASSRIHSPVVGPNVDVSRVGVGGGEVGDGGDTQSGKLFGGLRADAPQSVDLAVAHHRHPVGFGELIDALGLPNPVATLARCLLSLMPTEHDRPVPAATTSRICSANLIGSSESSSSAPT